MLGDRVDDKDVRARIVKEWDAFSRHPRLGPKTGS